MNTFWVVLVLTLMILSVITKMVQKKYLKEDTQEVNYSKKFLKYDLLIYIGFLTPAAIIVNVLAFNIFGAIALMLFIITSVIISTVQYKKKRGTISDKTYVRTLGFCLLVTAISLGLMVPMLLGV